MSTPSSASTSNTNSDQNVKKAKLHVYNMDEKLSILIFLKEHDFEKVQEILKEKKETLISITSVNQWKKEFS